MTAEDIPKPRIAIRALHNVNTWFALPGHANRLTPVSGLGDEGGDHMLGPGLLEIHHKLVAVD